MKTRIISASVAIVLLVAILWLHETIIFNIAFALIGSIMVYELFGAFKMKGNLLFLGLSILETAALAIMPKFLSLNDNARIYILVVLAYIVLAAVILLKEHETIEIGTFSSLCFITLAVGASMLSISVIEQGGLENVILTLCGAWLADSGAYFVGTFCGKHKLCPKISPKKTVEGFIGGIATNAVLFMLIGLVVPLIDADSSPDYILLAVLGVACSLLSVVGDLFASLVKRSCGIKDFGKIMPGHGGAFDRFDSVVFVAPFMAICLTWFSVF